MKPVFGAEAGFDWTDMGDGGLSRDPGSVLAAGLLFGKTFNEPQLCELSGLWAIGVGLVSRLGGGGRRVKIVSMRSMRSMVTINS